MSDVSGKSGPERQVEGRIALSGSWMHLTRPKAPVPGDTVRSKEVHLELAGARGQRLADRLLRAQGQRRYDGAEVRLDVACDFTGLTNGKPYSFQVRAHNAVGWSDWSGAVGEGDPGHPARHRRPDRAGPRRRPDDHVPLDQADHADVGDQALPRVLPGRVGQDHEQAEHHDHRASTTTGSTPSPWPLRTTSTSARAARRRRSSRSGRRARPLRPRSPTSRPPATRARSR